VKSGKKVAMIGVENAYPIGNDISLIKNFAERGARYMSLATTATASLPIRTLENATTNGFTRTE
jgi:microsomal dipeptidase-like Zn-dependent dipeptidase